MMTVESLKKEARRHEQREEWVKALDLYLQAIERQAEGDEPDIALHNRVGDLQIRLGDLEGAIESYDAAIRLYTDAELPNNAIAICRKIVRHDPQRPTPFLRMGQIRAKQGFAVDARENFVAYAEMMEARGETEEALRALEEFVGLVPEDIETRVFLAEQLASRHRASEAVRYLSEALEAATSSGAADQAETILGRIREIDPDFEAGDLSEIEPSREADAMADESWPIRYAPPELETDLPSPEGTGLEPMTPARGFQGASGEESEAPAWASDDLEITGFGAGELETSPSTEEEVVGEDHAATAPVRQPEGEAFDEEPTPEEDEESFAPVGDVPETEEELRFGGEFSLEELDRLEREDGESGAESEEELDLESSGLDTGFAGMEIDVEDLELETADVDLDVRDLDLEDTSDPVAALRARVEREPTDANAWEALGEALLSSGWTSEGLDALDHAHPLYAGRGEPDEAARVVRGILTHDPRRLELRQRMVEYAHDADDRDLMLEAFLELAEGLGAAGEATKAAAVFEQVLALDPENPRALDAFRERPAAVPSAEDVPEGEEPRASESAQGDYVDLGAMVLDAEEETTTRFVVPTEEPSGDEEADFARMLSQFKEKVAQNISRDDVRSHYDLGTAYKEMGLLREAIGEFQQALRAQPNNLATFEMLGQCFLDIGDPEVAIRTLERGLKLPTDVEDDLLGVYYGLAQAHEKVGDADAAREFYERIFSLDINFKDVVERLNQLR